MKRDILVSAAIIVASVLACTTARRSEPVAPAFVASDPAVSRGQGIWAIHCDQCHPGGEAGLGPAINNDPTPGIAIKTQVRLGVGAMPGFSDSRISDAQLDDLVAYVLAFRRSEKPSE